MPRLLSELMTELPTSPLYSSPPYSSRSMLLLTDPREEGVPPPS